MSELCQRIKQARTESGLTQAQLADELHVTRQTISNWENGRSVQDYEMLVINQYIERCGSIRKAAIALKSSSSTLSRKITEYYAPSDKENKK